jgi:hypothetical protein
MLNLSFSAFDPTETWTARVGCGAKDPGVDIARRHFPLSVLRSEHLARANYAKSCPHMMGKVVHT